MFIRPLTYLLVLAVLVVSAVPAGAFDGKRKGFVLGVGVGPGLSSYTQELSSSGSGSITSDRETKVGFSTDFRIGFGATERFLIVYDNKVNWIPFDNVLGEHVTVTDGISSLAVSYYLSESAPGGFLTGGLGGAGWSTPFEESSSGLAGFGVFVGGGYEFTKLWNLEGSLGFGSASDSDQGLKLTTNTTTFRVTINALWH
jgi:hypothetical protein